VYDRAAPQAALARKGLEAYARHPLMRTVGVDRTYYGPIDAAVFAEYAAQVPADFRFVVKADRALTFPTFAGPPHAHRGSPFDVNPDFLRPQRAAQAVIEPTVQGLGARLGCIVFQFPPVPADRVGGAERFAARLGSFLSALPVGPQYAVEVRTADLMTPSLQQAIHAAGAVPVYAVHPSLPDLNEQARRLLLEASGPLVIRWMLGHNQRYEAARDRYRPFDRMVDPDPTNRSRIAELCASAARSSRETYVIVNNKAEGSSPHSVIALARALAGRESVQ